MDLSGLIKVHMHRTTKDGFRGSYYLLPGPENKCVAKTCSKCKNTLPANAFSTRSRTYMGLSSACRKCTIPRTRNSTQEVLPEPEKNKSIFSIDTNLENLTEKKMKKIKGMPQGSYWLCPVTGECLAKSCSMCLCVLPRSSFTYKTSKPYGIDAWCTQCTATKRSKYRSEPKTQNQRKNYAKDKKAKYKLRTDKEIEIDRNISRPDGQKICRSCRLYKSFENFTKCRSNIDGLQTSCKPCTLRSRSDKRKKTYERHWVSLNISLKCYICGSPWEEPDHVIPKVLGGPDELTNLMPICAECNRGKGGKMGNLLLPWLESRFSDEYVSSVLERCIDAGVKFILE